MTPRAPPPVGVGGLQAGGGQPPLSNFRNMGHCVDASPGLHVVQGPSSLSDANG